MTQPTGLFTGNPTRFGGLSNEGVLANACPEEFQDRNEWSDYAMKFLCESADISNWRWRIPNRFKRRQQFLRFCALLSTRGLSHEDKEAVAGWMLSEMLTEVPEHLPIKIPCLN